MWYPWDRVIWLATMHSQSLSSRFEDKYGLLHPQSLERKKKGNWEYFIQFIDHILVLVTVIYWLTHSKPAAQTAAALLTKMKWYTKL
jgi:ADP-heptose:LPS heptosyltransferase